MFLCVLSCVVLCISKRFALALPNLDYNLCMNIIMLARICMFERVFFLSFACFILLWCRFSVTNGEHLSIFLCLISRLVVHEGLANRVHTNIILRMHYTHVELH